MVALYLNQVYPPMDFKSDGIVDVRDAVIMGENAG
jgi:hypothetical protein